MNANGGMGQGTGTGVEPDTCLVTYKMTPGYIAQNSKLSTLKFLMHFKTASSRFTMKLPPSQEVVSLFLCVEDKEGTGRNKEICSLLGARRYSDDKLDGDQA